MNRGCCWKPNINSKVACYFPLNFPGYQVVEEQKNANLSVESYSINKKNATFRPREILNLTVDLFYETEQRLRVKIYDKNNARYQVPLTVGSDRKKSIENDYYVNIVDYPFAIRVYRKSTQSLM